MTKLTLVIATLLAIMLPAPGQASSPGLDGDIPTTISAVDYSIDIDVLEVTTIAAIPAFSDELDLGYDSPTSPMAFADRYLKTFEVPGLCCSCHCAFSPPIFAFDIAPQRPLLAPVGLNTDSSCDPPEAALPSTGSSQSAQPASPVRTRPGGACESSGQVAGYSTGGRQLQVIARAPLRTPFRQMQA